MILLNRRALLLGVGAGLGLTGCGAVVPEQAPDEVAQLSRGIMALSPTIDPLEAERAADIGVNYPMVLRKQYEVEDSPIVHNIKVNAGSKPRGLCWHWAEDMQRRLEQEEFETIITHRAIANGHTRLLIDHSTVIVSGVDDTFEQGMVLDPWRYSGTLYWAPTLQDEKYTWVHRHDVFAMKRARGWLKTTDPSSEPLPT